MRSTSARPVAGTATLVRTSRHAAGTAAAVLSLLGSLVVVVAEHVVRRGLQVAAGLPGRRRSARRPRHRSASESGPA